MIVMIGIAGSGKSVQAAALSNKLGIPVISVGDIIRKRVTGEYRLKMLAGEVMPSFIAIPLIEEAVAELKRADNFILEGFARSKTQAQWILDWSKSHPDVITTVFHLHASMDIVRERLLQRGRADDNEESIHKRFKVMYSDIIDDIVLILKQEPIQYFDINAELPIERVTEEMLTHL